MPYGYLTQNPRAENELHRLVRDEDRCICGGCWTFFDDAGSYGCEAGGPPPAGIVLDERGDFRGDQSDLAKDLLTLRALSRRVVGSERMAAVYRRYGVDPSTSIVTAVRVLEARLADRNLSEAADEVERAHRLVSDAEDLVAQAANSMAHLTDAGAVEARLHLERELASWPDLRALEKKIRQLAEAASAAVES